MRRAAAVIAIAAGVWLLAMIPAFSLFARTGAAEKVTDTFRTVMSHDGLRALHHNYAVLRGMGVQFVGEARPELARRLGLQTAEFDRLAARQFPAAAQGVRELPAAVALVDPVIPMLEAAEDEFSEIDALPGLGLPIDSLSWLLLAAGLALAATGAAALRTAGRGATLATLIVGATVVVVALAFHFPAKFQAAHRILPVGRVALSQRAADTATATVVLVNRLVPEVQGRLVPALARRLGVSRAQVEQLIADRYPDVARGLREWPGIARSAAALAAGQRATVDDLSTGDGAPFRTLPWLAIGPALLAALAAAAALARRSRPALPYRPGDRGPAAPPR